MKSTAAAVVLAVLAALTAESAAAQPASQLDVYELPSVDLERADMADVKRQLYDEVAHFAVPIDVEISPFSEQSYGEWSPDGNDALWRFRLRSPGALSLSLAFRSFFIPEGGRLVISSADGREKIGPFTEADNDQHGQFWTPPLLASDIVIELRIPLDAISEVELDLSRIHHGYAGFGEPEPLAGPCQQDVACIESPVWRDVARSVALISIDGVRFCSGFMINNTALDGRPLLVTAHHCGITPQNAPSVVVMWNYESPSCRDADEQLLDKAFHPSRNFQTGARLRAVYEPTDVVLLELDDLPEVGWNVHYAGWDRSDVEPEGVTSIHHPNTDYKRLSSDNDRTRATFFQVDHESGNGDHLMVAAWDQGTTEGGSSGSPLFNQNQHVVGQLHGGYAECGEKRADWFGRFSVSWQGSGKPGERLSDWLDPLGTEATTLDGIDAPKLPNAVFEP